MTEYLNNNPMCHLLLIHLTAGQPCVWSDANQLITVHLLWELFMNVPLGFRSAQRGVF